MIDWNMAEAHEVRGLVNSHGLLKDALVKFCAQKCGELRESAASHMTSVPRNYELASDYAARAAAYAEFLSELEAELDKFQAGPTG